MKAVKLERLEQPAPAQTAIVRTETPGLANPFHITPSSQTQELATGSHPAFPQRPEAAGSPSGRLVCVYADPEGVRLVPAGVHVDAAAVLARWQSGVFLNYAAGTISVRRPEGTMGGKLIAHLGSGAPKKLQGAWTQPHNGWLVVASRPRDVQLLDGRLGEALGYVNLSSPRVVDSAYTIATGMAWAFKSALAELDMSREVVHSGGGRVNKRAYGIKASFEDTGAALCFLSAPIDLPSLTARLWL